VRAARDPSQLDETETDENFVSQSEISSRFVFERTPRVPVPDARSGEATLRGMPKINPSKTPNIQAATAINSDSAREELVGGPRIQEERNDAE
jgi:hypothetical protein